MSQASWKKWPLRLAWLAGVVLVAALIVQRYGSMRTAQAKEEVRVPQNYTRNVAIVVYEGVELLDFAGPGEVFAAAAHTAVDRGQPAFNVFTVASTRQP
jgi:hypothetical protein